MRRPGSWDKRAADFPTSLFCNPYTLLYICRIGEVFGANDGNMIHIGQIIRQELRNKGYTVSWMARELNCSRSNVYVIFEKPTLDTAVLMQISKLLDVDFFQYYTAEFERLMAEKG